MTREFLQLTAHDPDPAVSAGRGVTLVPAAERRQHAPDASILMLEGGSLAARCSCWWRASPMPEGRRLGVIGHYAAADANSGAALLAHACGLLASHECGTAVGPMDGSTWRRYRFIVERGDEPAFFLEPDNPDDWPGHWTRAGFAPLAAYTSAVNEILERTDPRTDRARERLAGSGITIRPFDLSQADAEMRRIFVLSQTAFSRNFLYTPVSEAEFLSQQTALLPHVRPELVLVAERAGSLVGFMFAVPDVLEQRRGAGGRTVVMKTLAVDPSVAGMGLGGALFDLAQRAAHRLGFSRAIHALIHDANVSRKISAHYARTIRRYALFARTIGT